MFDLYSGNVGHLPHRAALPLLVSTSVQATALAAPPVRSTAHRGDRPGTKEFPASAGFFVWCVALLRAKARNR